MLKPAYARSVPFETRQGQGRIGITVIGLFGNFSFRTNSAEKSKIRNILRDMFDS